MCVCVFMCVCRCLNRQEQNNRSPAAEVAYGCEMPRVGAGNQAWVLCKGSKCP